MQEGEDEGEDYAEKVYLVLMVTDVEIYWFMSTFGHLPYLM